MTEREVESCNEANAIFLHEVNFIHNIDWDRSKLLFQWDNYLTWGVVESSLKGSLPNFNSSSGNFKFTKVIWTNILRAVNLGEIN